MRKVIAVLTLGLMLVCFTSGCAGKEPEAEINTVTVSVNEKTKEETMIDDSMDIKYEPPKEPLFTQDDGVVKEYLSKFPNEICDTSEVFYIPFGVVSDTSLWDKFVLESSAGKQSEIIIGQPTIEGDIIYSYLFYTGEKYYMAVDSTRDKFGGEVDRFYSVYGLYLHIEYSDHIITSLEGEYQRVTATLTQVNYEIIKMEEGEVYYMPIEYGVCSFIREKRAYEG